MRAYQRTQGHGMGSRREASGEQGPTQTDGRENEGMRTRYAQGMPPRGETQPNG